MLNPVRIRAQVVHHLRTGCANRPLLSILQQIILLLAFTAEVGAAEPVRLEVDFSKADGRWNMPALALGQGGLQSDPMIEPHIKELRQLRPQTIRIFLSEYYRIYPDHGVYDWVMLDRELGAVRAAGARPTLALAMKPPVLYPKVDHFIVHPNDYEEWERLCEALARHCREAGFAVAAWEVCNEPDIGESGGTPQFFKSAGDYNTFYTHTVTGLLRGDPDAKVGGPAVANANSPLVEGLIEHCATQGVPLHFVSWHLYSDSPAAHAANIARQRARLAKFPQLQGVKLFISEWNMDLMHPNLAPGFQPCFVLETMRRYAEAGLDMAAYYHIRDCFVNPMDFDWMSPDGRRFMAHWWNTMPQYSALFDHHGRVRPAYFAFRLLGQLQGPRYAVQGEQGNIRAIAGEGDGYKHLLVWRYENGGAEEIEVRFSVLGVKDRSYRVVKLDADAPVNNIKVVHFGRSNDLDELTVKFRPWDIRWLEIE
jgi:xylan 1,4-beta-xylosidase